MYIVCVKCLEKINMTNTDNFVYKNEKREYFHSNCYYLLEELKHIKRPYPIKTNILNNIKIPPLVAFSKFNHLYDNLFDETIELSDMKNYLNKSDHYFNINSNHHIIDIDIDVNVNANSDNNKNN